jgi:uncharacterized damage-inducible protein DinB
VEEQLVETWAIHNRINLFFVEALTEEGLEVALTPRGRTVYGLFAHMHNVRLMWLKSAAPGLMAGLEKVEKREEGDGKERLYGALATSGAAIEALLREALAGGERIKGFKPHAVAFMGYLISHESHHRGQAELFLRAGGYALPDQVSYGLWEWGVR